MKIRDLSSPKLHSNFSALYSPQSNPEMKSEQPQGRHSLNGQRVGIQTFDKSSSGSTEGSQKIQ